MTQQGPPPSDGGGDPAPAIGAVPLPPGYVLVERLGSGGFATVWLAEQGRLGRRVAVKLLGETLDDAERERRFLAECQAIGRLSGHPAVVTVHDAGTTDGGHPYLVMEHLPGGSLHDRLAGGPLPWAEVLHIGVSVADALAAAHAAGILHRDVKPANVLLDENGAPKLGDFGIARLAEGTNTVTGTLVGTIPFTPPEVLSGHRPGPTADVWALGATLHTLLAGTSPFAGHRDEPPAAAIARVLRSEPPTLPPAVPAPLRDLVRDMLLADPAARPQTAAEIVDRLQQIQVARGLPVTPARATRDRAATPPPPPSDATVVGLPPMPTPTPGPFPVPGPPAVTPPGPFPVPEAPPLTPAAAWTPPPAPPAGADDPTVVGHAAAPAVAAAGATAVHAAPVGAVPPPPGPGAWPPAGPPPPPGGPADGGGRRSRKALLAVLAVVVLLAVAGGLAVALLGGGDDDPDDPAASRTTATDPESGEPVEQGDQIDTIWGTRAPVPTGVRVLNVVQDSASEREVPCGATGASAASALPGGGAVLAYPEIEGGTLQVEGIDAADGAQRWKVPVDTPADTVGIGVSGSLVILATTEDDQRVYRAFDVESGDEAWDEPVRFPTSDRTIRPSAQLSDTTMVVMLTDGYDGAAGAAAIDYATGRELWNEPGRVLSSDDQNVYVALEGEVVARRIRTGEVRWSKPVAVDDDGRTPTGRLGVVLKDILVTVSGGEVVGLNTDNGEAAWEAPVPLSSDEAALGVALAVSASQGQVVVAAEGGDAAFDPRSGTVAWREARAPLVVDGEINLWFGTDDLLVAGQYGGLVQAIATDDGRLAESYDLADPSVRAISYFTDGYAVLSDAGIAAYDVGDLATPLWTNVDLSDATTIAAVDGGILAVGPGGIQLLLAA